MQAQEADWNNMNEVCYICCKAKYMNWQNDETYLKALCEGHSVVLREIYRRFAPQLRSWVLRNNGNEDDAKDLMQDALMAIHDRYCDSDFQFTGNFGGLLLVVAKRMWFDQLGKKKRQQSIRKEELYGQLEEEPELEAAENALLEKQRMDTLARVFELLSDQCRQLLTLFTEGKKDPEKIAVQLGIPSANAVYQAKHRCLARWKKLFYQHHKNEE
ncbi:MAG TPA: sigma-70 family RNA polymerase sigma factor [Bacteroidetes bacterium]|nr:sigma-70 family RNA polymerase sigma factor [Bacteroidota bacterium]